jgi:hypothetical protein
MAKTPKFILNDEYLRATVGEADSLEDAFKAARVYARSVAKRTGRLYIEPVFRQDSPFSWVASDRDGSDRFVIIRVATKPGHAGGSALGRGVAVGALERGARTLAKQFETMGYKTEVDVFRSGRGGDRLIGTSSYVELVVEHPDGITTANIRFIANGYGNLEVRRGEIGGMQSWPDMATKAKAYLLAELLRT